MKKIALLSFMIFSLMFISGCSNGEGIEFNVLDVQNSELVVSLNKERVNTSVLNEFSERYDVSNNGKIINIKIPLDGTNIKESLYAQYDEIVAILNEYDKVALRNFEKITFEVDSSLGGYPFGAINTMSLLLISDDDFSVKLNAQGSATIDNSKYEKQFEMSSKDFETKKVIQFNSASVDSLKIKVEPMSDYKTVIVTYDIYSEREIMKNITEAELTAMGFSIDGFTSSRLTLSRTYKDLSELEFMLNMDMLNMFGIIGKIEVDFDKNFVKSLNINVNLVESELINDLSVEIKTVHPAKRVNDENLYNQFDFKFEGGIKEKISSTVPHYVNIIMILLISIFCIFVVFVILTLKKRGSHIKY